MFPVKSASFPALVVRSLPVSILGVFRFALGIFLLFVLAGSAPMAVAGGPRFVTGPNLWINAGQSESWGVAQLRYFTDAGALNAGVTHAQADAMVAAAAAAWNVPTSSLTLSQGGQLAEHVSNLNTYLGASGVVFPTDVQVFNEAAIPVAVVYDTDGSVTDLLLGSGASNPVACRQNAVTESVDDIQPDGLIHHAVLLLNGRCVGTAPEQLKQMQYQLTRAFGRVLGLAWSQTNDNVFTAATTVTADQETYWPLMHPLDVLCGPYSYQCMQNPFTPRADDLSALSGLYPVNSGNLTAGKTLSSTDAVLAFGWLTFPTGQGMDWVNVTVHRLHAGVYEPWDVASTTTGGNYQQALANPVTRAVASVSGSPSSDKEGFFEFQAVPIDGISNLYFTTEPINPLYNGAYALAPYVRPPSTPSGSSPTLVDYSAIGTNFVNQTMVANDAASTCSPGNDGTESQPAAFAANGWQKGLLCGWGHSSWWSATVRAGRTWTLEVSALNETGAASLNKAQPVMGVWNAADATGTLPTIAAQGVAFNSMVYGMTQMRGSAAGTDRPLRFVIGDQFGAGRPDFPYSARLLYADAVSPSAIGNGGGVVTLQGTGFQAGNVVRINGVAATVQSLSATQITLLVPSRAVAGATIGRAVTVSVSDPVTGGSTTITGGLTYTSGADLLTQVSAPGSLKSGTTASVPFALQVLAADGVTRLAGVTVNLSVTTATAQLGACGTAPSCWVVSDSNGQVQSTVTGIAAGVVTLTAVEISGGATVQVNLQDADPVRSMSFASTAAYVAAGIAGSWTVQLGATQDGSAVAGVPLVWTAGAGLTLSGASAATAADGSAAVTIAEAGLPAGTSSLTACAWDTLCTTWTVNSVDPSQWQVSVAGGAGQSVVQGTALAPLTLTVTDMAGHPLPGAVLNVYQRVLGWQGLCPANGACPSAPVMSSAQAVMSADAAAMVSVQPLQVPGMPQTLQIALTWGQQGFLTCTLVTLPALP